MIRACGLRFHIRWIYLQVYVSLILLCCSAYFLVQLLYCQSQIDTINQFELPLYACPDLCPDYPYTLDSSFCCTDSSFTVCTEKYSCLQPMIAAFINKENDSGVTMSCLVAAVPLFILIHLAIRVYLKRRDRNERRIAMQARLAQERSGMPSLQSFFLRDQENQCSICLQDFKDEKAIILNCGHIFHNQCIRQWGNRKRTCPVCRTQQ